MIKTHFTILNKIFLKAFCLIWLTIQFFYFRNKILVYNHLHYKKNNIVKFLLLIKISFKKKAIIQAYFYLNKICIKYIFWQIYFFVFKKHLKTHKLYNFSIIKVKLFMKPITGSNFKFISVTAYSIVKK